MAARSCSSMSAALRCGEGLLFNRADERGMTLVVQDAWNRMNCVDGACYCKLDTQRIDGRIAGAILYGICEFRLRNSRRRRCHGIYSFSRYRNGDIGHGPCRRSEERRVGKEGTAAWGGGSE